MIRLFLLVLFAVLGIAQGNCGVPGCPSNYPQRVCADADHRAVWAMGQPGGPGVLVGAPLRSPVNNGVYLDAVSAWITATASAGVLTITACPADPNVAGTVRLGQYIYGKGAQGPTDGTYITGSSGSAMISCGGAMVHSQWTLSTNYTSGNAAFALGGNAMAVPNGKLPTDPAHCTMPTTQGLTAYGQLYWPVSATSHIPDCELIGWHFPTVGLFFNKSGPADPLSHIKICDDKFDMTYSSAAGQTYSLIIYEGLSANVEVCYDDFDESSTAVPAPSPLLITGDSISNAVSSWNPTGANGQIHHNHYKNAGGVWDYVWGMYDVRWNYGEKDGCSTTAHVDNHQHYGMADGLFQSAALYWGHNLSDISECSTFETLSGWQEGAQSVTLKYPLTATDVGRLQNPDGAWGDVFLLRYGPPKGVLATGATGDLLCQVATPLNAGDTVVHCLKAIAGRSGGADHFGNYISVASSNGGANADVIAIQNGEIVQKGMPSGTIGGWAKGDTQIFVDSVPTGQAGAQQNSVVATFPVRQTLSLKPNRAVAYINLGAVTGPDPFFYPSNKSSTNIPAANACAGPCVLVHQNFYVNVFRIIPAKGMAGIGGMVLNTSGPQFPNGFNIEFVDNISLGYVAGDVVEYGLGPYGHITGAFSNISLTGNMSDVNPAFFCSAYHVANPAAPAAVTNASRTSGNNSNVNFLTGAALYCDR